MKLLLFDIDGTLLHSHGAGREALVYALEQVFGTAGPINEYNLAGKTDPRIIHDLMTVAGIPAAKIEAQLGTVYSLMASHGREFFPQKELEPCPGVLALLAALQEQPDAVVGLLTGNVSATAPLKLAAAGIDPTQFRLGAYGSDHIDRNKLPEIARQRAQQILGITIAAPDCVIIGDTPADIACARALGAQVLAVASGSYATTTLAHYHPDYLVDNLLDTTAVLKILLSEQKDEPTHP